MSAACLKRRGKNPSATPPWYIIFLGGKTHLTIAQVAAISAADTAAAGRALAIFQLEDFVCRCSGESRGERNKGCGHGDECSELHIYGLFVLEVWIKFLLRDKCVGLESYWLTMRSRSWQKRSAFYIHIFLPMEALTPSLYLTTVHGHHTEVEEGSIEIYSNEQVTDDRRWSLSQGWLLPLLPCNKWVYTNQRLEDISRSIRILDDICRSITLHTKWLQLGRWDFDRVGVTPVVTRIDLTLMGHGKKGAIYSHARYQVSRRIV